MIEIESSEIINGYDESLDENSYIEEDYELADIDDNDGTTYLVEYINEEPDADGEEQLIHIEEDLAGDDTNVEYTDILDDVIECSDAVTNEMFTCSLCGMQLKNIHEHVAKYHPGKDVVVDVVDYRPTMKPELFIDDDGDDDEEIDVDTKQLNILPDDDADFSSTIIQMDDEVSIMEGTSDFENADMYEFESTIETSDDTEQSASVSANISFR